MEIPLARYSPGGDIYQNLTQDYGLDAANKVYAAAQTGQYANVIDAMATIHGDGPALDQSTADAFVQQITTDPLAAPLASANKLLGNTWLSFLKNPMVLLTLGVIGFFSLGGAGLLRRLLKKIG